MLVTRQASPEEGEGGDGVGGGGGGEGSGEGVPLVELKSFTTQAFFACWRAIHLGLLQVI